MTKKTRKLLKHTIETKYEDGILVQTLFDRVRATVGNVTTEEFFDAMFSMFIVA
jgi:hypothetical protein